MPRDAHKPSPSGKRVKVSIALQTDVLDTGVRVDRAAGVIYNVAVATAGVTKISANNVGPFDVDRIALQQVANAINATDIGVKSRITHPEVDGADDIGLRLGYIRNARVAGNAVRADMHFHDAGSTHAITLMDIAEHDPGSCGLSLVSETAVLEPSSNTQTGLVMRLDKIESVDWVGEPAANPAGMLSAHHRRPPVRGFRGRLNLGATTMNEDQKQYLYAAGLPYDATDEQIAAFVAALSEDQKAQLAALKDSPEVQAAVDAAVAGAATDETAAAGVVAGARRTGKRRRLLLAALNAAQVEYLVTLGLTAEATDEQLAALTDEQKTKLAELADPPATDAAAGVAAAARRNVARGGVTLTSDQVRQAVADELKAERARAAEIRAIALRCGYDEKWITKHINDATTIGEVRRVALSTLKRSPHDMPTTSVAVGSDLNRDSLADAVMDAIMLRAGVQRFARFDERGVVLSASRAPEARKPHDRAGEFRGHSIVEMGRRFLLALGYRQADRMDRVKLAGLLMSRSALAAALPGVYLAHSTGDFPHLLADVMGKVLRTEYALAPQTWPLWCNRTTAPDFKDIKKLQLSEAADLVEIPEGDEYEYGTLSESKEVYALSTFGKGLKFTRRMLINDDLSAFDRVPRMLGQAAARKVEGLAIAILTANAALADGVALFATAHANVTTGALTVVSLGAARAAMRKQTALGSSDPLDLMPALLIVPEQLFVTASQLVSSAVDPAKSNATPNPFANQLQVISSPRLDADSTTEWYLSASPAQIDTVDVGFLEGEETPVVEEEDEFDTDSRKIKVRHECVAKAIDYRGLVRSSGS